jgi:hypothetical protein
MDSEAVLELLGQMRVVMLKQVTDNYLCTDSMAERVFDLTMGEQEPTHWEL